MFHVKDYLSPKEIHEKGLAPILDAMEVAEFTDPSKKKRLLQFLFPDRNTKFEDVFGTYIKQKGTKSFFLWVFYGSFCGSFSA